MFDIHELLADISYASDISNIVTSDAIYTNNDKQNAITESCTFDISDRFDNDGIDFYFESYIVGSTRKSKPMRKPYKEYDFKGHNSEVGAKNRAIAEMLRDAAVYSRDYHGRGGNNLFTSGSKYDANMSKYNKIKQLIEACNSSETPQQNIVKISYASDNIGKLKGQSIYVIFAEVTLPSGTYWLSWHLRRYKDKDFTVKVCDKLDKINGGNGVLTKYGKKSEDAYLKKEEEYQKIRETQKWNPILDLEKTFDLEHALKK